MGEITIYSAYITCSLILAHLIFSFKVQEFKKGLFFEKENNYKSFLLKIRLVLLLMPTMIFITSIPIDYLINNVVLKTSGMLAICILYSLLVAYFLRMSPLVFTLQTTLAFVSLGLFILDHFGFIETKEDIIVNAYFQTLPTYIISIIVAIYTFHYRHEKNDKIEVVSYKETNRATMFTIFIFLFIFVESFYVIVLKKYI
jgi:hypothetical protein